MIHKKSKYLLALCCLALVFLLAGWGGVVFYVNSPQGNTRRIVNIPEGASLRMVATLIGKQRVVRYPGLWELYVRLLGHSALIRTGEYLIPPNVSGKKIYQIFISGKVIQHRVTLRAGITFNQALTILKKNTKMTDDLRGYQGRQLLVFLGIPEKHPEGLFYPDTYFYTLDTKMSFILLRAYRRLMKKLDESWRKREKNLPYATSYEALIMASLIEKETAVPEERSQISGVLVRRLQKGMRLQSDPTVIYGLGDSYNGNLTKKDLRRFTPYNTYRIGGLPPTPVSLVTQADIEAALHPAAGKALYFVAKGDGTHVFSDTLAGQRKAIKQYQLNPHDNYRSFPLPKAPAAAMSKEE